MLQGTSPFDLPAGSSDSRVLIVVGVDMAVLSNLRDDVHCASGTNVPKMVMSILSRVRSL